MLQAVIHPSVPATPVNGWCWSGTSPSFPLKHCLPQKACQQSPSHGTRADSSFERTHLASSIPQLDPDWSSIHQDLHCSRKRIRDKSKEAAQHTHIHFSPEHSIWYPAKETPEITSVCPPSQTSLKQLEFALKMLWDQLIAFPILWENLRCLGLFSSIFKESFHITISLERRKALSWTVPWEQLVVLPHPKKTSKDKHKQNFSNLLLAFWPRVEAQISLH